MDSWTVSPSPEKSVTTQKHTATSEQEKGDAPIEEIAVHYDRMNRIIENEAVRNRQQEENVRSAELDFMFDLKTLIKETAANPDMIDVQYILYDNKLQQIPEEYKQVAKRRTHRWGITMVDDRIINPKRLRYEAVNVLHFGHPGMNKMCSDPTIFWWPNMRSDIRKKAKTCSACLNARKNLK